MLSGDQEGRTWNQEFKAKVIAKHKEILQVDGC